MKASGANAAAGEPPQKYGEHTMNTEQPNRFGLFDAPVRPVEKERVVLTRADIEGQLEAGAFIMDYEEAIAAGFINPHDEPDTVLVDVVRENA
jgi:hypothetical protein